MEHMSFNGVGLWTLYLKEIRRFWKVGMQTVMAPMITTLLFFAVFVLALGRSHEITPGLQFTHFLIPGLIMMAVVQNAFANSSSSLIIAKVQGNIVDLLMAPLGAAELTLAFALGAVTRGAAVGLATLIAMVPFVDIQMHNIFLFMFYVVSGAFLLGLLGMMAGIWAEKFDNIATITNFIVTPLSFLSGTFYSIKQLPEFWQTVAFYNPFFYMIDGARYAMTGYSDGDPWLGVLVLCAANLVLGVLCYRMLATGYRLRP